MNFARQPGPQKDCWNSKFVITLLLAFKVDQNMFFSRRKTEGTAKFKRDHFVSFEIELT